ncbi:hypothetical protein G7Y89_g8387 [Cudoniella acicularis]|uniref:Protein kinase domain-containing protein n=1 Tax=Cudoniella acicularis TaxID=354080 RepID=A0A8H4W3L7_9HELO|nr:hypothetical protein G7Y89_g8387 [Cudoniella acicularis]
MDSNVIVPAYSSSLMNEGSSIDYTSIRPSRLPQDFHDTNPETSIGQSLQWEYLGSGSQFIVYKQTMVNLEAEPYWSDKVATKHPKVTLDSAVQVNLADPKVQGHLHHMFLELLAMTDKRLRRHPNIASLVAWSYDAYGFHTPLNLVMELADCNLADYLEDKKMEVSLSLKYRICQDTAAGLDALHECGIIHGDLKPENILLYYYKGRFIARLADFGLSRGGHASEPTRLRIGGTLGWQAPEVEDGELLTFDELPRVDSYSLGLLIWSILLHGGKAPPPSRKQSRQLLACREIELSKDIIGLRPDSCLPKSVFSLLANIWNRPLHLEELFEGDRDGEGTYSAKELYKTDDIPRNSETSTAIPRNGKKFSWELASLNINFVYDLYSGFKQDPESLSGPLLFSLFLACTLRPPKVTDSRNPALDLLVASASRGYEPAQAVVPMVYQYFESEIPPEVNEHILEWSEKAVASGSILAREFLGRLNIQSLASSLEKFRNSGGYSWIYCTISPSGDHSAALDNIGYSRLHWLATYGTMKEMTRYLDMEKDYDINSVTENEETALYLAAARGSWEIVNVLLSRGACPAIKCTSFKISCMHWLFAFDKDFQTVAAIEFLRRGADLDATTSHQVPFLHYPFLLPSGTPLHWAVATSSNETIQILVELGANVLLRDGRDPYVYDDRVRVLDKLGGPNQEYSSLAMTATQGLSSLDLATMQYDPFIFNVLLSLSKQIDINAVDEEGFSVLHRLSTKPESRTRTGNSFSILPFRGAKTALNEGLRQTINAIKALGGNLEQTTTPFTRSGSNWKAPKRTPLMLALLCPAYDVVEVLVHCGADVTTENDLGETVLHCLPQAFYTENANLLDPDGTQVRCVEVVKLIASYGADISHHDIYGQAPIIVAANCSLLGIVDFFLSAGADIDERSIKSAVEEGRNLFALLSRSNHINDFDLTVAELLKKYVFSCPDEEKRRRVIEVGDPQGETLLHRFAMFSMPHCVQLLLKHGAPPNPLMKNYTYIKKSGKRLPGERIEESGVKSTWYETPLDCVSDLRAFREKQMASKGNWSISEYKRICQRDNQIIAMLEKEGGKSIPKTVVDTKYTYTGPKSDFLTFMRRF